MPEANTGGRGSSQDKDAGVARRSHDACTAEGIYSVVFRHRGQWVDSRGGNDGEELQQVHAARACRGALGEVICELLLREGSLSPVQQGRGG